MYADDTLKVASAKTTEEAAETVTTDFTHIHK